MVVAEAVELVGNRPCRRAVDKCVGGLTVHALIHGSAPVIHKSTALLSVAFHSYIFFLLYPASLIRKEAFHA